MSLNVFILGVNGFIGNRLAEIILEQKDWQITGLDIADDKLQNCLGNPRFHFNKADLFQSDEWIKQQIQAADVVLPLAAIANPLIYVQDPVRVFELDFEANLKIVKWCLEFNTRIVFPSTSEVYGMATDQSFDEDSTNFILGPINKERWIYSCSKQMLDRVIYAYGKHKGLSFSLFRPFNWIGPNLDKVFEKDATSSRVLSKFIGNIVHKRDFDLVDGGQQRRTFIYIDDGIDALVRIIENKDGCAEGQIFNIGNPANDMSIKELADNVIARAKNYAKYQENASQVKINDTPGSEFYGAGYQDVSMRVPAIRHAEERLGWKPSTDMATALDKTVEFYLSQ